MRRGRAQRMNERRGALRNGSPHRRFGTDGTAPGGTDRVILDLRSINANRFSRAKHLWTIANVLRLLAFGVGASVVFQGNPPLYVPPVLFAITVAAELFQWRSDAIKTRSEAL